jgi:DNA-binding response OmpR family regulator
MAAEPRVIKLLLVEDDPAHVELVRDSLGEALDHRLALARAATLGEAIRHLVSDSVDVMLLDLHLPDSRGLETFLRAREAAPEVPIVALTALDDAALALGVMQEGAQDYLVKGQADGELLERTLRYAIERKRADRRLLEQEQRLKEMEAEARANAARLEQQARELRALERLTSIPYTSETARAYGLRPLREGAPEVFQELVRRYRDLLDLAIEERTHKVEYRVSASLRDIADQLGRLKAGPRDVIELHRAALGPRMAEGSPRAPGYVEVGRLLALELMGYLVSYYRNYVVGTRSEGGSR